MQRYLSVIIGSFLEVQFQSFADRLAIIHCSPQRIHSGPS
jgi:hypothetical protein